MVHFVRVTDRFSCISESNATNKKLNAGLEQTWAVYQEQKSEESRGRGQDRDSEGGSCSTARVSGVKEGSKGWK